MCVSGSSVSWKIVVHNHLQGVACGVQKLKQTVKGSYSNVLQLTSV